MKIKFLGTSFGAPSKGRHQQSILIEDKVGNAYLFDTGAPVLDILINNDYDLKKIKAIFISHLHGDHLNGIFDIINLTEYLGLNYTVFLPEQKGIDFLSSYCINVCGKVPVGTKFRLFDKDCHFSSSIIDVSPCPTEHTDASIGFLVTEDKKSIHITGDLHPTLKDFPAFLTHTDLIVCECAHFSVADILSKLEKCDVSQVAFVHVAPHNFAELSAKISSRFEVIIPNDGDEI